MERSTDLDRELYLKPEEGTTSFGYLPIEEGQIRVLCLQPGEPGSPLSAKFEVLDLETARRAQPDLHTCDADKLDFDESETTLRRWRQRLAKHQDDFASLDKSIDAISSLSKDISALLSQKQTLERDLRPERSSFSDSDQISIECAALRKLYLELHSLRCDDVNAMSRKYSTETYRSLYRTALLLTKLSQAKRDAMVRDAVSIGAYETISYAWDNSGFRERLQIEGCEQYIPIASTVFDALQQLRYQDQERRLWIDALCINQPDLAERSHQVSNMSQIYRSAARTIVWLGRADTSICLAYGVLEAHLSAHTFNLNRGEESETRIPIHITQAMNFHGSCGFCGDQFPVVEDRTGQGVIAMELLASKPWFTRLWVVQEVASASFVEVHCGTHQIPWKTFDLLMRMLCDLRNVVWDIRVAVQLSDQPYSPCVLIWFLVTTSRRKCTLERDRVYAIQSITGLTTNEVEDIGLEMRYTELFIRLAEHCLTSRNETHLVTTKWIGFNVPHVAILLALAPKTVSKANLPSWAPDWNYMPDDAQNIMLEYSAYLSDEFRFGLSFNRSSGESPLRSLNLIQCNMKDSRLLSIRGYHLGEVTDVLEGSEYPFPEERSSDKLPDRDGVPSWFGSEQWRWYDSCRNVAAMHWSSSEFDVKLKELLTCIYIRSDERRYCRIMYGDGLAGQYEENGRPLPTTRQDIYDICSQYFANEEGKVDPHRLAAWTCGSTYLDYRTGHLRRLRDRRLCVIRATTGLTFLGWIPQTAEVGDRICLFDGAPRPYVMRPHGDEDGSFRLLGDSWLHGWCELDISEFCAENKADLGWIDLK